MVVLLLLAGAVDDNADDNHHHHHHLNASALVDVTPTLHYTKGVRHLQGPKLHWVIPSHSPLQHLP